MTASFQWYLLSSICVLVYHCPRPSRMGLCDMQDATGLMLRLNGKICWSHLESLGFGKVTWQAPPGDGHLSKNRGCWQPSALLARPEEASVDPLMQPPKGPPARATQSSRSLPDGQREVLQ